MKFKKVLLVVSIICIFLCISAVSADENATSDLSYNCDISDNVTQSQTTDFDDEPVTQSSDGEDELGETWIYFDSTAIKDGDGSLSNPYKYLKSNRITSGSVAYFNDGVYEISEAISISSPSSGRTVIMGQSTQNTIFTSALTNNFDFTVNSNSYLLIQDVTFRDIHINNHGKLIAFDSIFEDNVGFEGVYSPSLSYTSSQDDYDSEYGGVIICDTPSGKQTYVGLSGCVFSNNMAFAGGVLALDDAYAIIQNCMFYDCLATNFGGAIYSRNSELNIINSSFSASRARFGGAVYFTGHGEDFNIRNTVFTDSEAESFGGAIAMHSATSVMRNCTFDDYRSLTDAGGAIYTVNSTFDLYTSSFSGGHSNFGGAVCNLRTNFTLLSSNFTNNEAKYYGGSLLNVYGNLVISNNLFMNSHANSSGGAIYCRMADSLNLQSNVFSNTSSIYGHMLFIDGDEEVVYASNNVYRDLYNLVCVYRATLNGQPFILYSNYLTFSVSSNGDYIIPLIDSTTQPTHTSQYADFSISVEGFSSSLIYEDVFRNNKLSFDLTKYSSSFADESLEMYIIDEAGDIIYSGSMPLQGTGNYNDYPICEFSFSELMLLLQYGHIYDINQYGSVALFNYTVVPSGNIPSAYDSRDYGYITPAKDQMDGGNCWAFSGIATLEACLKKATGITYDFSEENVKNLMSAYSLFGWKNEPNDGGNLYMFIGYVSSWFGPIYNEYDLYDDYSALSVIYDSALHIQNVYCLPNRANSYDNDVIKRAIMDYGAVSISVPDWNGGGHAITLIGWDDEYSGYDYFKTKSTGAWIFKNSWGDDWKDNGCFYLSYEKYIENGYTFIFKEDPGYNHIYQYDFSGTTASLTARGDTYYYKNTFTSAGDDILSAVSTFFYNATDYVVSVYVNGNLATSQQGHSEVGYYTIPLNTEIPLTAGDKFTVEFKILDARGKYIPVCWANVITRMTFDANVSFYRGSLSWYDCYEGDFVMCIKAFTRSASLRQVNISVNEFSHVKAGEMMTITADVPIYYVQEGLRHYLDGFVTFIIDGKYYYAMIKDGKATLNMSFDEEGTHTLTAQYRTNLEISNIVQFTFNVGNQVEDIIEISASDVSKYYGGPQCYAVTVTNNNVPVAGVYVRVSFNNVLYDVLTNNNGVAVLGVEAPEGTYIVTAEYAGKSCSSKFTVKSTISVQDTIGYYSQTQMPASFLDSNGNQLSYTKVTFRIDDRDFQAWTSYSGSAAADITLNVGIYDVTVINPTTGERKQAKLEIRKMSTECSLTVIQNGAKLIFTATVTPDTVTGYVDFVYEGITRTSIEDGIALFELSNLGVGDYSVSAVYVGDDNYHSSSDTLNFSMVSASYQLNTYPRATVFYGYNGGMWATVTDDDGYGVSGQTVTFTCENTTCYAVTDSSGRAEINVGNYSPGEHTFHIEYRGQSAVTVLTVISSIPEFSYCGEYSRANVTAEFTNEWGRDIAGAQVTFRVGTRQFTATTDSEGYAAADLDLDVGSYTVTVVNPVTGEEKSMDIVISKANPEISLTMSQNANEYIFTANVAPASATGTVIFTVSGVKYTESITNGKAVLDLINVKAGTHVAYATYSGDGNYNSALSSSINFTVSVKSISIVPTSTVCYYDGYFKVLLTENDVPVDRGIIKFTFASPDGQTIYKRGYYITGANGTTSSWVNVDHGNYVITCDYGGESFVFDVTVKSTIQAGDVTARYPNDYPLVKFLDNDGSPLSYSNVIIRINGQNHTLRTDSTGYTMGTLGMSAGTYVAYAVNPKTKEEKQFSLKVTKADPVISVTKLVSGNQVTLNATFNRADVTGKVIFTISGQEFPVGVSDGYSALIVKNLNPGTYYAYPSYSGDANYNGVNLSSVSFTIEGKVISITPFETVRYYGSKFMASVTENSASVINGKVHVIITSSDGSTVFRNANYSTGYLGIVSVPVNLASGIYRFTCEYGGKSVTTYVTVKTTIQVKNITTWYNKDNPGVTFLGTDGNPLANASVNFRINGVVKTLTTNSNGVTDGILGKTPASYIVTAINPNTGEEKQFKMTVNKATPTMTLQMVTRNGKPTMMAKLSDSAATGKITFDSYGSVYQIAISNGVAYLELYYDGTYTVTAKYPGNSNFNAVSQSLKVTVKKNPKATVQKITKTYGDSKKVTIKVTNPNGKPYANGEVYIEVEKNGDWYKDYVLDTDSKGYIKLGSNFAPGTYNIYVNVYVEDDIYVQEIGYGSFVVKKIPVTIKASKKTFKKSAKNKKYTVTLKVNGKVKKNQKMTIKVKGKKYTAKTNSKGKATFNLKKLTKKGTFKAVVKYVCKTWCHKGYSKKVTIKVK